VQPAPQTAFPAGPEPVCVQSVIEIVHGLHGPYFILQIRGGQA